MEDKSNVLLQSERLESGTDMLDRNQRRRIRRLFETGLSITRIAEEESIDRKTIYKILREDLDVDPEPVNRPTLLDGYTELLAAWLEKGLSAAWMHRALTRNHQFDGSYDTVKNYVAERRPRKKQIATVRFETEPGDQAQCDWAVIWYPDAQGVRRKAYCFSIILCYSRTLYAEITTRCDRKTLVACHERAFRYFGGIPAEIVYDRQSPVYVRQKKREIQLNPVFAEYARSRLFEPVMCMARRAQTKGKIERPYRFVREDFFLPHADQPLASLQKLLPVWLDTEANARIHRTTHERPMDRLMLERQSLQPLVDTPFVGDWTLPRRISRESMISYLGSHYSAPWKCVDKTADVWDEDGILFIRVADHVVARHELAVERGTIRRNPAHYEGLVFPIRPTTGGTKARFIERFPGTLNFMEGVYQHKIGNVRYHLSEIIEMTKLYGDAMVLAGIRLAEKKGDFSCGGVRLLCEKGLVDAPVFVASPLEIAFGKVHPTGSVEKRSLAHYDAILKGEGGVGLQ